MAKVYYSSSSEESDSSTDHESDSDSPKSKSNSEVISSTGAMIKAVQALPNMDEDLILDACDFLEDKHNASIFIALDLKLRRKWLMRKLRHQIHICVRSLSGRRINLDVLMSETIAEVKVKVKAKLSNFLLNPKLTFAGKELEDNQTLDYYKVHGGATLHLR